MRHLSSHLSLLCYLGSEQVLLSPLDKQGNATVSLRLMAGKEIRPRGIRALMRVGDLWVRTLLRALTLLPLVPPLGANLLLVAYAQATSTLLVPRFRRNLLSPFTCVQSARPQRGTSVHHMHMSWVAERGSALCLDPGYHEDRGRLQRDTSLWRMRLQ